tara:strand:+ start:14805 stop:16625 length:1821 start_codon:yes stop_codon:yes gene_type:complete
MPTVNGPDEITTLTGGADKVFYTDSNGDVKEVSIGTDGQTLVSTGATAPEFDGLTGLKGGVNSVLYTNATGDLTELGLSATAGDVLTSNGAAVAPTWEATEAGGVYTATSSAAITNGHVAILDAAGTLGPVGTVTGVGPPSTAAKGAWQAQPAPSAQNSTIWDPDSETLFILSTFGNLPQIVPCTVDWTAANPTVTTGTAIPVAFPTSTYYNGAVAVYDKTNNKLIVAGRDYTFGNVQMTMGTVTGSGASATISWSTAVSVRGYAPSWVHLTYMHSGPALAAGEEIALTLTNNTSGYKETVFIDCSGASPVTGLVYSASTSFSKAGQPCCDGSGNLKWPASNPSGSAGYGTFYYGSGYMGYISVPASSTWGNYVDMGWDTVNNRGIIVVCNNVSPSGQLYMWEINDTGAGTGNIVGTDYNLGSVFTGYMDNYQTQAVVFDEFAGTMLVWWVSSSDRHMWIPMTLTGSQVTAGTNLPSTAATWVRSSQPYGNSIHGAYAFGAGKNFAGGLFSGSSETFAIADAFMSTNENYWLGVAKNTTTGAGQSQEVYVIGGVANEGLSGLTIGTNYYWQSNGQVGTANTGGDRLVGKAIAADKILVENTGTGAA